MSRRLSSRFAEQLLLYVCMCLCLYVHAPAIKKLGDLGPRVAKPALCSNNLFVLFLCPAALAERRIHLEQRHQETNVKAALLTEKC